MNIKKSRRGVSKAEWLEAGLHALSTDGVAGVTVEGLARSLGIAKAGFYWHFKDRQDLLRQLLDYWAHETTEVVSGNARMIELDPKSRLIAVAEMILKYDLVRYELAMHQWALQDKVAARAVKKVMRMRLDFIREAFTELGFMGDDLDMRSMLFVCYQTWESPTFRGVSRKRRHELIAKRVELLTSK